MSQQKTQCEAMVRKSIRKSWRSPLCGGRSNAVSERRPSLNTNMKTLIAFLLIWIGAETDYNVKVPNQYYTDAQVEMNNHVHGEGNTGSGKLHAFYDPKSDNRPSE